MNYKEKYFEIINNGLKEKPENGYYEGHHIVPKSICPLLKKTQINIVYLTAKNHFLAHYYIWKWFKEELNEKKWARKMCYALYRMKRQLLLSNDIEKISDLYQEAKIEKSKIQSETMKGEKNPFYKRHHSEETKQKISEANTGRIPSEETRQKLSELRKGEKHWNFGKHLSETTKQKISESGKGKRIGNKNALGSKGHSGLKWITNGVIEKTIPIGETPPPGFRFGRSCNKLGKKKNTGN